MIIFSNFDNIYNQYSTNPDEIILINHNDSG